jgi:hypothetical protein
VTQLSRPYQIAIGALAVLVLVWFVALRGHSGGAGESSSSSAPAAKSTSGSGPAAGSGGSAQGNSAGSPSPVYHGSAPGVEGLTRDINKAHGAVAASQQNARQLQRSSAQASGESSSSQTAGSSVSSAAHASKPAGSRAPGGRAGARPTPGRSNPAVHSAQQLQLEHALGQGKTVLLLFWQPRSSVDNAVRSQALQLGRSSKGRLAVQTALPDQVGLFGPVTEVVHVYQTPTVLIVGRHGLVSTLTGLTDAFALRQAVREAEQVNR